MCRAQYDCFCSSLISCFLVMLLWYCPNDFEIFPVAPFSTGITFAFTCRMRWILIMKSLYFKTFSASFSFIFLSTEIAPSFNVQSTFLLWKSVINRSVSSHSFVTSYGNLCDLFQLILVNGLTSVFFCLILPPFPSILSVYVWFFCQYWACWFELFHCLMKLFTESAFAVCFCW